MWIAPNFDGIVPELKAVPNWVLAKAVERDGKVTKPPFQPNGGPANHSDPRTWSKFEDVREAYLGGGYVGVGFVLDGKPRFYGRYLHALDWDHCLADGVTDSEVREIVERLVMPRLEVSASGKGLRAFFLHETLLASRRTIIKGRSVELYSNKRYMTTTGVGGGLLA